MSEPATYSPKNRPVTPMRKPGEVSIDQGVAEVKAHPEEVREQRVRELDALIESLQIPDLSRAGFRHFRIQCIEIRDRAAALGFEDEKAVAKVLCSLVGALGLDGVSNPASDADLAGLKRALEVLADGLRFLRRSGKNADDAARRDVVDGLRKVADKRLANSGTGH